MLNEVRNHCWVSNFHELLFTPKCILCSRLGKLVCPGCLTQLKPVSTRSVFGVSGIYCAGEYSGWLREVLISYKNGNQSVGPTLAKILINTMTESPIDFPLQLIPIPSSLSKIHKRGYDSMTNLCIEMSKLNLELQVVQGALYLKQEVRDQVGLCARERQENLADAFAATTRLSGRALIVDDVVTTGATIANAAKALRIAGAQTIYALTLCG